jgi:monoamine oxidase
MKQFSNLDYLEIINIGLPQRGIKNTKKVIILGAGMAGLTAAYELKRIGYSPLILEAQSRIGGRIYTMREPFLPGLYAEAGAMRIPKTHSLTMAYIARFGLETYPFNLANPQAFVHINGQQFRFKQVNANPDLLGFDTSLMERKKTSSQLWEEAIAHLVAKISLKGDEAWEEIASTHDQYSVREYLEMKEWSEGAIEMFGLLNNQESMMNSSFLELLREEAGRFYQDLFQIKGGMDRLPNAFMPELKENIRLGARVIALDQTPDQVIVHYRTPAGLFQETGDYAIITLPFPVLRHIEVLKPFSQSKQRAIRQLHYDASAKIFLQCTRRFWEDEDGIYGGGSITDLAIRNVFYPEHGRDTGRGVLLASYTWSEDAQRWGSLSPSERIIQAVENIAQIHPQILTAVEGGASQMWHDDQFAGGAFALFDPGQQSLLHEHIIAPEGRFFFAGEHASSAHAWIQGAIESGLRAAYQVHHLPI